MTTASTATGAGTPSTAPPRSQSKSGSATGTLTLSVARKTTEPTTPDTARVASSGRRPRTTAVPLIVTINMLALVPTVS